MNSASAMDCQFSVGTDIQERMEQFLKSRMLSGETSFNASTRKACC